MSVNSSLIGQRLKDRYQIIAPLKLGGIGETYLAEDLAIPQEPKPRCVVKRLRATHKSPDIQRLFQKEAEILNKLKQHPQIPTLDAFVEDKQEYYLVQEFIEGDDLSTEITSERPWSEIEVVKFLEEILDVLAFVHQNRVIHRDIKPQNIMRRNSDEKLVLIDFGAVKEVATMGIGGQGRVSKTIPIHTPGYAPREQMSGEPRLSSDIYAVGITAIEALTGRKPQELSFDETGELDWRKHAPGVSNELANILTKMVQFEWQERYSNATVALKALRQANIEPVSRILSWILLKAVVGFINDRFNVDLQVFEVGLQGFINYLAQNPPSVTKELQKAVKWSYLKAEESMAVEYQRQLAGLFPTFMQYSPFQSQEKREKLRWIQQKIDRLNLEFKRLEKAAYIDNLAEKMSSFVNEFPAADEIYSKKEELQAALLAGDDPAEYAEKLRKENGGLLHLICVNFVEWIKDDQLVREMFESGLLKPINFQLTGSTLTITDLEKSLLRVTLDLGELRRLQDIYASTVESSEKRNDVAEAEAFSQTVTVGPQKKTTLQLDPELENPGGTVPLHSSFYVQRPPIEADCYETIVNPGALIRIKAPRQMGKSSLMMRILDRAQEQGYKTAWLTFQSADAEFVTNLDKFLQWFCGTITDKLNLEDKLAERWQGVLGSKNKCDNYFQRYLLSEIDSPLVLGLDEVDEIFQHKEVAAEFFGLLRSWHERGKNDAIWKKLRLVIVHSQEVYIPLNINQSPFNVGLPIDLRELNEPEVDRLVRLHQLNWRHSEVEDLMEMVGGHPYLVRQALYQVAKGRMSLEHLLDVAPTQGGPYSDHLRRHVLNLEKNPDLSAAMRKAIATKNAVHVGTEEGFKLRSMGLVKFDGNAVKPLCELYRIYFSQCLEVK